MSGDVRVVSTFRFLLWGSAAVLLGLAAGAPTGPSCDAVPIYCDEGTACDDGDLCTFDDTCVVGLCVGTPVVCGDGNPCNGRESCDAATGECVGGIPAPDGTPCDDGDDCTSPDLCEAGTCTPSRIVCTPDRWFFVWGAGGGRSAAAEGSLRSLLGQPGGGRVQGEGATLRWGFVPVSVQATP